MRKSRSYYSSTAAHVFIHYSLHTTSRLLEYLQMRQRNNSASSSDMPDIDCLWFCYYFHTAHMLGIPRCLLVLQ
jgi:hypothetical protein